VDDQRHHQNFDKHKGYISKQVNEDVMGIFENQIVQKIEKSR
jgi:hypothetical protein